MSAVEAEAALPLSKGEAAAVAAMATAFADVLPAGPAEPYRELAATAEGRAVPPEQVPMLERVCSLALETGKARQIGRAEFERLLTAVLRRTPHGRALTGQVEEVNRALGQLAGRQLDDARLNWGKPGHCELSISAGGVNLTVAITPDAVTVRTLSVG
ncbi:MAG: hypothetical protein ACRDNW_05520 [Trebonia sp.]